MYKISWLLWVTAPRPNQREPRSCRPRPPANALWLNPCREGGERRRREGEVPGPGSDVSSQLGVCPDSWHGVGPGGWGRRERDGTGLGFAGPWRGQSAGALNSGGRWSRTFGTSAGGAHPQVRALDASRRPESSGTVVWLQLGVAAAPPPPGSISFPELLFPNGIGQFWGVVV